jgi:hypothetical protein
MKEDGTIYMVMTAAAAVKIAVAPTRSHEEA